MKNRIIIFLSVGLFSSHFATAQNPFDQFKLEHWNTKNGMPNDLILNVYQTKDGFIWTTGYTGLTRFDGVSFTSFNSRTVPLLKTDNIEGLLYETNDSTLWIPTPNSGLLAFKKGVFKAYLTDSTNLFIQGKTAKDELLLSIGRRTLNYVLFDTHLRTYKNLTNAQGINLVQSGEISNYDQVKDQSGNTWIFDRGFQLNRLNNGKLHELTPKEGYYGSKGVYYYEVYVDSRNRVWLAASNGLFLWNGNAFKSYPGMGNNIFLGTGAASTGLILEDKTGGIWAATGSGIAYLPAQSNRFIFYPKNEGLPVQNINNIMEDKEGNIWFSSSLGLYKLSRSKFITYSMKDGLDDDRISAVCALDDHRYLVATSFKLFLVDNGVVKPYPFKNKSLENFNADPTWILKDSNSNIWICFTSGDIIRISKTNEKLFSTKNSYQARGVFEDDNHKVWFGFGFGGIGFLNEKDQIEFINYPKVDFKSFYLSSIRKLKNGNWLLTSFNKGILVIDNQGNPTYYDDKSGLPTVGIFSSYEDPDGTVWLTTQSGITRYKNGVFSNIGFKSGLPENSVFEFLPDHNGDVWFPSNRGLIWAKKQELNDYLDHKIDTINWKVYDDGDGMLNRQCVGARHPAITPNGHLLFPTFGGLVEVDPNQIKKNTVPPSVEIDRVLRDDYDLGLTQNQKFTPGSHRYIFQYSGLSFVAPQKVRFKFKLIGYDKDWISAVGDRKAFYTNIPSGKYTFQVIACNNDEVWNDTGASYSFTVTPFFYETAWFRILLLIVLSLLIWLIIRWRTKATRKQNELLEAEVASRTDDLNKANSELSQSLENLKATQSQLVQAEKMASLGELTAGIAHEIQNPLNFVNNFSEVNKELLEELKMQNAKLKIEDPEVKELVRDIQNNSEKINHHGKRADAIVKGMLQHSRQTSGTKEPTDINALCDEYLRLAYHGLRAKDKSFNAKFETDFDNTIEKIEIMPQDIGRVVLNLINNAFYAVSEKAKQNISGYEPTVTVSTKKAGDKISISVKDNGNGIPDSIKEKIFQPFFTTKPTGSGTGLGLSLSYDIVKAHGGKLKVESLEGNGSEFIISLPFDE